ncbi:hypothetical protein IVB56_27270 [Bradyrhizobium sp. CW7]|uniref:hypothetical protein n=1 Tax=Bradyrhizobium sp. CW7 TaxID=2782688 RepID=UPI001FF955E8|nr:hypothetical protein [Bradyrhizobium sp. CW7]MCK1354649.1 hypothetical protein [Bradyrhizobium sp. CW7]
MVRNKKRPPAGGTSGGDQELTIVVRPDSNTPEARAQVILAEEAHAPSGGDPQQVWPRYVRVARNWHRRGKLKEFVEAFAAGEGPDVEFPELLRAAVALTRIDIGKTVPPLPTDAQFADLDLWLEEAAAEHQRSVKNQRWERELRGLPRNGGNGKPIGPARLQKSKYDREELLRRLRLVIAQHDEKLGGFERRYLDHASRYYIPVRDGGISNKQLVFLANFIADNAEERSTEAAWKIVSDYLNAEGST